MIHIALELWGSVFCFISAFCIFLGRAFEKKKLRIVVSMQLANAFLLIADAGSWYYRGYLGKFGYYSVRIFNFTVFFFSILITIFYHAYICSYLFAGERRKFRNVPIRVHLVYIIGTAAILLLIISQFTHWYYYFDENNVYHRNSMYALSVIVGMLPCVLDFTLLIQYRKRLSKIMLFSLIAYLAVPMLTACVLMFYYGISLLNICLTICMIFIFLAAITENRKIREQKEKEMADLRIEVMLSQISPHFIYNTLTAIQYLCVKDPMMAEETVGEFAAYLRNTIDSLTTKKSIPFEKELEHVKNYLAIEKKRFGDCVHVIYDIKEKEFEIPTLTIQPIVENAIKYGIGKKENGGTVWICTEKTKDGYQITVKDNGVGFDVNAVLDDKRSHIGIHNVKSRLKSMCGGVLQIESVLGEGTEAIVRIPYQNE